jgi:hypothetical protein
MHSIFYNKAVMNKYLISTKVAENNESENATQENNKLIGDSIISKTPKIASTIPVHGGLYDKNCY